jgi:hypothetical protein
VRSNSATLRFKNHLSNPCTIDNKKENNIDSAFLVFCTGTKTRQRPQL